MRHSLAHVPATRSFVGEVTFAKVDNYIRSLENLLVGDVPLAAPSSRSECDAAFFMAVAAALRLVETQLSEPLQGLPIQAVCDEGPTGHPLNWLNVTERKKDEERRQCHEWCLTLEDDGSVRVTYEHGKFGYRREAFDRWSAAFDRMGELLAGTCTWDRFGDDESQRTMLGKGQFYWQDPKTEEPVPVDNFVFAGASGVELTLAGVSHRCALSFKENAESGCSEWFDDYAQGLLRMADILDGRVLFTEFGKEPNPRQHSLASCTGAPADAPWAGQFVVKSIYTYGDELVAPVLTYITGEGAQAQLITAESGWVVRICDGQKPWRARRFEEQNACEALRTLADVLTGAQTWDEFDPQE